MRENVNILGVFHDGSIIEISGELPTLDFRIEIEYLRHMFPSVGKSFLAHVTGCESIEFYNWESESRTKNVKEIQEEEPEILSVEQKGDFAHIICSTGELAMRYKDVQFKLDSGESLTYKELIDTCGKYWEDWKSRKNS